MNVFKEDILALIDSDQAFYAPLVQKVRDEERELRKHFRDQPDWVSGWGHAFACPHCAARFAFDEQLCYHALNRFVCPHCGETASGKNLDEAWVFYYRHTTAGHLEATAACALLGDAEARSFLERYLDFYAENYAGFAVHENGGGKLMPQLLDEAVWCIRVLRAFYPCRNLFSAEKRSEWYRKLFAPLVELIDAPEEQAAIHNHVLWHKCAVGAAAICFEEPALLDHALDGQWGIAEQIRKGMTADGLWLEGSLLYHYYAMEALTGFCQFLVCVQPQHPLLKVLEKAYTAPLALSHNGWDIPSLNDGWYPLTLERFADQIHRTAMTLHSQPLLQQLERLRRHDCQTLGAAAALLLDRPAETSVVWEATRLAVLKQPFHAILKAGSLVRSHMHCDCLSIVIAPFSVNVGTPGYGHPLYRSWYVQAPAHNTIAVDYDQPHEPVAAAIEAVDHGARAVIMDGWKAVKTASRTLTGQNNVLCDRTEVICDGEHVVDWFFHATGDVRFSVQPGEAAHRDGRCGYEHLTEIRRLDTDRLVMTVVQHNHRLTLEVDTNGMEAYAARSPGNPATELRTTLILRVRGERALFDVRYTQEQL